MESRVQEAVFKKQNGYNCAQAVACTYCDLVGMDEETMRNATAAFAVGMGAMEASCGAITGAGIIVGLLNKDQRISFGDAKKLIMKFKEQNGSVVCKELKGIETGKVLRECNDCVADATRFLEEICSAKLSV